MRVLVYVNENPDRKHITIHCEKGSACGYVFQQLTSGNTRMNTNIEDLSGEQKEAIKIAETDNGYWILLWVKNYDAVESHSIIQPIAQRLGVQPRLHC